MVPALQLPICPAATPPVIVHVPPPSTETVTSPEVVVPSFLTYTVTPSDVQTASSIDSTTAVFAVNIPEINIYALPARAIVITSIKIIAITADIPFISPLFYFSKPYLNILFVKTFHMKKIILDTNFLIDLIKFKVDLEDINILINEPYQLFSLSSVVRELKNLSKNNKYAKGALRLLEFKKIKIIKSEGDVDKFLLTLANKNTIISTNDIKLKKKLKEKGMKVIYLRGKKKLAMG